MVYHYQGRIAVGSRNRRLNPVCCNIVSPSGRGGTAHVRTGPPAILNGRRADALPKAGIEPRFGGVAHAHILHQGADLLAAAERALVASAEQWTAMRADVFKVLAGADRPSSAYDIAEEISRLQQRRVAANSVYRILDLFVAKNLALRIESSNAYVANPHPGCVHDCIFLICNSCLRTTHVDNDLVARGVRKTAAGGGFSAERTIIEVRGMCENCRQT